MREAQRGGKRDRYSVRVRWTFLSERAYWIQGRSQRLNFTNLLLELARLGGQIVRVLLQQHVGRELGLRRQRRVAARRSGCGSSIGGSGGGGGGHLAQAEQ